MIYVTGDIHGCPQIRFGFKNFPESRTMTKDDYVIVCGDFGVVWEKNGESKEERYNLKWLEELPFTVLFVDGNHENFDRLKTYAEKEWNGGRVHEIRPHVLHLMRGYVFSIDGVKIFTFGGAASHDISDGILNPDEKEKIYQWRKQRKNFRIRGITWWDEELPSQEDMDRGLEMLEKCNYEVDYVITHTPTANDIKKCDGEFDADTASIYLESIKSKLKYKYWFCGHMHMDKKLDERTAVLFQQLVRIH